MALRTPPPQVPVVRFDSPNKTDLGLVEFWNTEVSIYLPIDIGAPHPNTRQYAGYTLGIQSPVEGDEKWVRRVWVTDNTNQDWYNYQIQLAEQATAYPTYIRTYQERRDTYMPRARLSPLQTVYKLTLTLAGSGYDPSLKSVALTFSAGTATGRALIDADGKIRSLILDSGGSGYTVAPTFTIPAPTNAGVTATGTAAIQPTTALLVKEQAEQYPEDNENFALYLNVVRVYMTLPGPWIYDDLYRGAGIFVNPDNLALEATKKRINIPENIPAYTNVFTGATGAITAVLTGQTVTSGTITNAGTGYADFVALTFSASPTGRTAMGYATATAGLITAVVITDGGTGYNAGAPTVIVIPKTLVTNERKDIDFNTAWEVQKFVTQSPFNTLAAAQISISPDSFPFPGLIDVVQIQTTELANVGYVPKQSRRIDLYTYRYWVISATTPSVPSWDTVIEDPSCMVGKSAGFGTSLPIIGEYSGVLHDAYVILFTNSDSVNVTATYAATTPTLTVWRTWVGAQKKILPPKVIPTNNAQIWLIEEYSVIIPQLEYLTVT